MAIIAVPESHFGWIVDRTGVDISRGFRAIGLIDSGDVQPCPCGASHPTFKGMVGYSDWTPTGCAMHFAYDIKAIPKEERSEAMRAFIKAAFDYPFKQSGRKFAIGLTRAGNTAALRVARRLGFREAYRIKDGWQEGEDLILSRIEATDVHE